MDAEFISYFRSNEGTLQSQAGPSLTYPETNGSFRDGQNDAFQPRTAPAKAFRSSGNAHDLDGSADTEFSDPNATLDLEPSTELEESSSRVLEQLLTTEMRAYETEKEKILKKEVLEKLDEILLKWMDIVKRKHGIRPDPASGNAVLLCYGSYKLGVSSPGGDIDTMILAPYYVNRDQDFFGELYPLLKELAKSNPNIREVNMVNQQHTIMPLIKMEFYDIPIDMVFATVQYSGELQDFVKNHLYDEDYMQTMDEKMKGSFNGFRNAELILKSLKRSGESRLLTCKREEVFRTTLKCIKLWAKNNGLDSNKMGYLGGIAWALLTAKVCKLYPHKCPARLLERFFEKFGFECNWDESVVRIVEKPEEKTPPRYTRSMYIMTPARPQTNTTHNVTISTREIMTTRMRQAHKMVTDLLKKQEKSPSLALDDKEAKSDWQALFNKFKFFEVYEHFIEINILGGKDCDYLRWKGFVEAKVRILCEKLEELTRMYDLKIHPWPNSYDRKKDTFSAYPQVTTIYIGLRINSEFEEFVDLNLPMYKFIEYLEAEWRNDNPKRDPKLYNISVCYRLREEIPKDVIQAENEETDFSIKQTELVLSAHKSAIKDNFNDEAGFPEEDDNFSKASQAILMGADLFSPGGSLPPYKLFDSHQLLRDEQGTLLPFGYFDQAMRELKGQHDSHPDIFLQKRPKSFHVAEPVHRPEQLPNLHATRSELSLPEELSSNLMD